MSRPMSAAEGNRFFRRGAAALSAFLSIAAWGTLIGLSAFVRPPPVLVFTIYALALGAVVVGVIASRWNKDFLAWRITADVGLILGLVLVVLGVVNLIMFAKGWEFV